MAVRLSVAGTFRRYFLWPPLSKPPERNAREEAREPSIQGERALLRHLRSMLIDTRALTYDGALHCHWLPVPAQILYNWAGTAAGGEGANEGSVLDTRGAESLATTGPRIGEGGCHRRWRERVPCAAESLAATGAPIGRTSEAQLKGCSRVEMQEDCSGSALPRYPWHFILRFTSVLVPCAVFSTASRGRVARCRMAALHSWAGECVKSAAGSKIHARAAHASCRQCFVSSGALRRAMITRLVER
ncbi:hypothetical protein C8R44DRAFT_882852 [Mycena epipterygia]|nr:hypothetical protein C8R44DRAFT_882852 [Mycena epipterygia]